MSKDRITEQAKEVWNHAGLECAAVPSPFGTLNGYVRLPEGHPLFGKFYDDFDVRVHGGLTYGCDEFGWVGFDTLHAGDWWPEEYVEPSPERAEIDAKMSEKHGMQPVWSEDRNRGFPGWTPDRLREEVNQLADQIAAWPSTIAVLAGENDSSVKDGGDSRP